MAGTTDDNTISADDWRLANDESAFATEIVGFEERARDLLLNDLAEGLIRWDCDRNLAVRGDFQAYPLLRATFAATRGHPFFWRRDEHSRVDMDWSTNCATWTGRFIGFGWDGRGNSWPNFDPRASTSLTVSGVRFHHGDVVKALTRRGLTLGGEAALAAPVSQVSLESEQPSATAAPALATTTTTTKKRRLGSQEQWIAPAALEIYGEVLPLLSPAQLQRAIEARQKAKTLKTSLPPHWVAGGEACKRFLQKQGKLRPR